MYLEENERAKIRNRIEFDFKPSSAQTPGEAPYPGDSGTIHDLDLNLKGRNFRVLLFESGYGRDELLTGRFIYGQKARRIYRNICTTVARAIQMYFPEVPGYIEKVREHQILRAGANMTLAPFIEGLKTRGDDFKRWAVKGQDMFNAGSTTRIEWGNETARIFSDVCIASGSTLQAFVIKALEESDMRKLIINTSVCTVNSLNRIAEIIPEDVEVTVICWMALFSVWRKNITLPDGEVIPAGTVINLNPDTDFPENNPLATRGTWEYIETVFQKNRLSVLPDIPGEVGEKLQDSWIGPIVYDILEFYSAGIDLSRDPWYSRLKEAWELPGVGMTLKDRLPYIYNNIEAIIKAGKETVDNWKPAELCRREFVLL